MSMTYKQNLKLSLWDKLIFGGIVVVATIVGNFVVEERKLVNAEALKSVDRIVQRYEEYSLLLDDYKYQNEEIQREKDYLEMLALFQDEESEEYEEAKENIENLDSNMKSNQKDIHNKLRSADIEIGRHLQNHLLHHLSYLAHLYSANDSLRKSRMNKVEWSIENSTAVIEEMEEKLRGMRLSILAIRKFAIDQAMP